MKTKILLVVLALAGFAFAANAGSLQRIGNLNLLPRHNTLTNANGTFMSDDKGLYAAVIDVTNGYAYFFGNYLTKVDITGPLPVKVGTNIQTGQFLEGAIDIAAGYAYMPRYGGTIYRFALGAGTNSPSAAGTLALGGSGAISIVIDDSDPNPANHYGYVLASGTPATVYKVALSTFSVVSSATLNAGENNFAWGQIDTKNGYAYFASYIVYTAPAIPQIIKIKLTPGAAAPIRLGNVNLGATPVPLWTSSIDTLHGYAYYATDNGTTNLPETLFKVALGTGDSLPVPTPFGGVALHTNEVQIVSQIIDPAGGYMYLNDDNTYPGRVYQFTLNGTNPPVELGYLSLQAGAQTPPPDGVTGNNATTNADGILPLGEVYLRSAVFDPARGFAYIGQDSRPNQIVKIQVERDFPINAMLTLSSGENPSGFKDTVTFSGGVTTNGVAAGNATGSMQLSTNGILFGPPIVLAAGSVSASLATLPRGTNTIMAAYAGDANYTGGTNLIYQMVTNHPPVTSPYTVSRTAGLGLHIFFSDLTNHWSDADGDPVTLQGVNLVTTNGVTVQTNSLQILYTNCLNVDDQITYAIGDGQGGTNMGIIHIVVNPFVTGQQTLSALTASNNAIFATFYERPAFIYELQRSTNLIAGTGWVTISTNTAGTNGLIQMADTFPDLGGQPPASAYYRLQWQP